MTVLSYNSDRKSYFHHDISLSVLTLARSELVGLYKGESNPKLKERLLLIIRVEYDGLVPAHVAKELHRSKPWASYWLDRYEKEGVEGLKDKPMSGRPPEVAEKTMLKIRKELSENQSGWQAKQVMDIIYKKTGVKYHEVHVYRLLHKWGFSPKVPQKTFVNTASREEKEAFKKTYTKYSHKSRRGSQ